jgi:hypothetical protein
LLHSSSRLLLLLLLLLLKLRVKTRKGSYICLSPTPLLLELCHQSLQLPQGSSIAGWACTTWCCRASCCRRG